MQRLLLSALLLVCGSSAFAQSGDPLKPTGPVTVTADQAEWQDGGVMKYTGNVQLQSDTLKLAGDVLELKQHPDGQYEAQITGTSGKPAKLDHSAGTDKNGKAVPPVSAQASKLAYDSKTGIVDIVGSAKMTRGSDEITGQEIHYNARERRIQAAGGSGGQVKIVIQPPPEKNDKNSKKP